MVRKKIQLNIIAKDYGDRIQILPAVNLIDHIVTDEKLIIFFIFHRADCRESNIQIK